MAVKIVQATAKGFYDNLIRKEGDKFYVPEDTKPANWFKDVAEVKAAKAAAKADEDAKAKAEAETKVKK